MFSTSPITHLPAFVEKKTQNPAANSMPITDCLAPARNRQQPRCEHRNTLEASLSRNMLYKIPFQGADLNIRGSHEEVNSKSAAQGYSSTKTDYKRIGGWVT
jgi:hypothetical protein